MDERGRDVAWDEDVWPVDLHTGSAGYVSSERADDEPVLLVPDGAGGYRVHRAAPRRPRRMGF